MDYETLDVLYKSRQTLLKILAGRGYNTKPYEKFGPVEIGAMGAAGPAAFRMDLERSGPERITKCRVVYSFARIKNRLASFLNEQKGEEGDDTFDPATTELIVILLLDDIVEAFHLASLSALASPDKLRVSFFKAHSIVNNPLEHILVPKHTLMPPSQHAEFLKANKIKSKDNLPIIKYHEDMIARIMGLLPGDIVEITRPSPSAGEYVSYRVCKP